MVAWNEEVYCDGCHRACHLSAPRCGFGAQQAREFDREREAILAAAPKCPGCHCQCSLADPQCGRGGEFAEKWKRGEEIPQRPPRGKGGPKPGGKQPDGKQPDGKQPSGKQPGGPRPFGPQDDASRLVFLMPIGMMLQSKAALPLQPGRFLGMLHFQGDWMKMSVLEEKARMNAADLYPMVDRLVEEGYLIREFDTLYITQKGVDLADLAHEQSAADNAHLFDVLEPDELEAFSEMWQRLMGHWGEMAGADRGPLR